MSSELTSWRAPSPTEMILSALRALSIAELIAVISERSVSEAMRPAGSSLPELIRRPVLRRSRAWFIDWLFRPRIRAATIEGTLVLIRLMFACLHTTAVLRFRRFRPPVRKRDRLKSRPSACSWGGSSQPPQPRARSVFGCSDTGHLMTAAKRVIAHARSSSIPSTSPPRPTDPCSVSSEPA